MQRVPPFSYSIFIVRYKTGRDYRPPFEFFSALCDFFSNFLSPKGSPSSFLIFYSKLKFQKAQRVSPFKFFGTMRLAQNSCFSIFRFFLEYFFNVPKGSPLQKALPFGPARYIRSLRRYTPQQIGFSKKPKGPPFLHMTKSMCIAVQLSKFFPQ